MSEFVAMAILGVIVVIGGIMWESAACHQRGSEMGLRAQYGVMTGCMIHVKGQWTPLENYRVL